MEDERVISLTAKNTAITAEFLLKMLYYGIGKVYEVNKDRQLGNRVFTSETEWSKFMESIDPITIKDLKYNEVNLDKFKAELKKYNIGFSFYKHIDNTVSLAYKINNKDIVEKAISETIEKIVKEDNLIDKVKKTPDNMNLSEKLNYYKEKQNIEIKQKGLDNSLDIVKETSKIKEKSL